MARRCLLCSGRCLGPLMVLAPNALNPAPRCVDSAPMAAPRSTRPREQLPGGWGAMAGEVRRFASRRPAVGGFDVVGTHTGTSPGRRVASDARSRLRDESGFGLVEVLVALLLLAVVSVPTAYALTEAVAATSYGQSRQVAAQLVNQGLQQAEADYPLSPGSSSGPSTTANGVTYTVSTTTTKCTSSGTSSSLFSGTSSSLLSGTSPSPMYDVVVVVTWTFSGHTASLSGQTLVFPPGGPGSGDS